MVAEAALKRDLRDAALAAEQAHGVVQPQREQPAPRRDLQQGQQMALQLRDRQAGVRGQFAHRQRVGAVLARIGQAAREPRIGRVLGRGPAQVARDADQALHLSRRAGAAQGMLDREAPAGAVIGEEMALQLVVHTAAAGDHAQILCQVVAAELCGEDLGRRAAEQLVQALQPQPCQQCAVGVRVAALQVLAEEHHVGQVLKQIVAGSLELHGAIVQKSSPRGAKTL